MKIQKVQFQKGASDGGAYAKHLLLIWLMATIQLVVSMNRD